MTKKFSMALTMVLVATTMFFAQPIDQLKKRLNLTDEQSSKVVAFMTEFHKTAEAQGLNIKEQRIKLRRELLKNNPSEDKIKEILDKIANLKSSLEFAKLKNALEIKKILTPEQFMQWQEMMRHGDPKGNKNDYRRGGRRDRPMRDNMHDRWEDED